MKHIRKCSSTRSLLRLPFLWFSSPSGSVFWLFLSRLISGLKEMHQLFQTANIGNQHHHPHTFLPNKTLDSTTQKCLFGAETMRWLFGEWFHKDKSAVCCSFTKRKNAAFCLKYQSDSLLLNPDLWIKMTEQLCSSKKSLGAFSRL